MPSSLPAVSGLPKQRQQKRKYPFVGA
jgi:hypothetical protein